MIRHAWCLFCATLLSGLPLSSPAADPTRVALSDPSPLAASTELIERQFSPLEAFQLQEKVSSLGLKDAFHIDLAAERLLVRAPDKPAADGRYGLLIFLDSRKQARLDFEWNNALDAHGVIFVSPDNAGDDARALDRRIPLALHAYEYARRTYNLDPDRIYVAGADGGSRVAQRLAFSFPDVFTGVIVNSGAVELGTQELPAPAPELLRRLRTRSRLVFATAAHIQPAFSEQQRTLESMRTYCVPVARVFENGHTLAGHTPISGRALSDMLGALEAPPSPAGQANAGCEQALRSNALSALANIRQLQAGGQHDGARRALVAFDHAYGRLFLDQEVAVAKTLNPGFFGATSPPASSASSSESH